MCVFYFQAAVGNRRRERETSIYFSQMKDKRTRGTNTTRETRKPEPTHHARKKGNTQKQISFRSVRNIELFCRK